MVVVVPTDTSVMEVVDRENSVPSKVPTYVETSSSQSPVAQLHWGFLSLEEKVPEQEYKLITFHRIWQQIVYQLQKEQ
jgi:hypothetical protein